ncbi:hypothetical protein [Streptomyces sp. NPDC058664]|uniref:hypothetical protein n=1 Tax=unclassified Streptomyces TaxID=2593676 RepID=UPI0036611B4D
MGAMPGDRSTREFLAGLRVGDLCGGAVAEIGRSDVVAVVLDGSPRIRRGP